MIKLIKMRKVFFSCPEFDYRFKLVMLLLCITAYQVQASEGKNVDFKNEIQKRTITGVVKDATGMVLPGANVLVKGTTNGVMTDFDGEFKLDIEASATTLVVSYVGFESQEVTIGKKSVFSIVLNESNEALKEVVVVGFGTQKKASLVSSITTISPKELKGPTSNLTTMMAGRVAGMIAFQRSGEPGADNSDFFIRGLGSFGSGKVSPLILIDGIESSSTDMARLQPDDIESFSVLKDAAAAAVYGARGANGVVLITTKMGKAGKTQFQLRSETRISSNTKNFKFADNITYMNLANEAYLTRVDKYSPQQITGLPYQQYKIYGTSIGADPLLYPSNNWVDELIKDYTVNQGLNMSAQGGGEKAKYYISGTYNIDNGVLDVEGLNNFNNNIKLRNYSIRSNLDLNLTSTTKGIVRVYGQFDDYVGPVGGGGRIFNLALWSNPVKFPKIYPSSYLPFVNHPLFGGAPEGSNTGSNLLVNPYAEMVRGYQSSKASTIQAQVELQQNFDFITEGLSARAMGYVRRYSFFQVSRFYNPFYYEGKINPSTGELNLNVLNAGGNGSIGQPGREFLGYNQGGKDLDSRIYLETAINYSRTFNEKHTVSGMLVNVLSSYEKGNAGDIPGDIQLSLPKRNHSFSGRFTYGYDDTYMFEFNFGYNGSERFANGSRYGYFPSLGFAYRMSNENYWNSLKDVVSDFKLRFTHGLVGNDAIGSDEDRFFYLSKVVLGDGRYGSSFGEQFNYYNSGVYLERYANPNIGWEESLQTNIGLDIELFNSLNIVVDAFKQKRTNILEVRQNIGATLGLTNTPSTNFGEVHSKGLDGTITFNKSFNEDWYTQIRANFTYSTNETIVRDEVSYPEELSYLSLVGNHTMQGYGYIAERLFIDDEEVANSPAQFGDDVRGGDIKYRDVNGDGEINGNDIVPIGYPTIPEIVYGFGGTVGYKAFDFSIFFQGAARTSFFINPENISPFVVNTVFDNNFSELKTYQNGLLDVIAQDHWSEANRDSYAFWPRLSERFNTNNNQRSTWWMRDGSFLRLKTIEAGYNFPESLVSKIGMQSARLYFSGNNLAVWSKFRLWDPEMGGNGLGYPIQSVYNLGLKIDF